MVEFANCFLDIQIPVLNNLNLSLVRYLYMKNCPISSKGVKAFLKLSLPHLKELFLEFVNVTTDFAKLLRKSVNTHQITV